MSARMLRALHMIAKTDHIRDYLQHADPKALEQVDEAIAHAHISVGLSEAVDRLVEAGAECRAAQDLVDHAEKCEKCGDVHDVRLACRPPRTCMCGGSSFTESPDPRYLVCDSCTKLVER